MPNGGSGWGQPGQRETISRGERTDPRVIIGQAAGFAAVGTALILLIMAAIMLNVGTTWKYIWQNWRWLLLFPAFPWIVACVLAAIVLFVEIFDPNYPNPRKATETTRVLWPWSKERMQAKTFIRARLTDLDVTLDGDDVS